MDTTENYGLKKPGYDEGADIEIINGNADIIDAELKKAEEHRDSTANPHKVTAAQVGASNPNLLINGDFRINQRGLSSYSSEEYTLDRWHNTFISQYGTSTVTRISNGGKYGVRITISSLVNPVNFGNNFLQVIENAEGGYTPLSYKTITFSAECQTTGFNRCIYIGYAVGGTNNYVSKEIPKDSPMTRYSISTSIPGNAYNVQCGVGITANFTSSDLNTYTDIYEAKLEIGSVATPFVPRPYAEELALCQRYFLKGELNGFGHVESPNVVCFYIPVPVTPKTLPTVAALNYGIIFCNGVDYIPTAVLTSFMLGGNVVGIKLSVPTMPVHYTCDWLAHSIELDAEIY